MSPRRVWRLLREPREITALSAAGWLVAAYTGTIALLAPPLTISGAIGPILTVVWGLMLVTGATLGTLGCLLLPEPWWRWVEQSGILLAGGGVLVYEAVVLALHIQSDGPGSRLAQMGFVGLGLVFLALRWILISDPARALRRRGHADGVH